MSTMHMSDENAHTGRTALITGASSGVGAAIAMRLAQDGMALAITGRDADALGGIAAQARALSATDVRTYPADLTVEQDIRDLAVRVQRDFARLDVLIHCAGMIASGTVEASSVDDLDLQYRTNIRAPYLLTQLLLPRLRAGKAQVVFVNSSATLRPMAGYGQYAATKQALRSLADALREEVNGDGVRVLSVFLGSTATRMQAALHQESGKQYRSERLIQPAEVASLLAGLLSAQCTAEVTDITLRPMLK
jgi:short-subunit dehydrogenase